ncbi:MAG: hypothetical protein LM556_01800 [Desulfurococcaceae archaeon]|nr:hypothetical protein [Desulfurococcaceae archaeon]
MRSNTYSSSLFTRKPAISSKSLSALTSSRSAVAPLPRVFQGTIGFNLTRLG